MNHLQFKGRLACCSPWGHKESNVTEQLNKNKQLFTDITCGRDYSSSVEWYWQTCENTTDTNMYKFTSGLYIF